jgi:hypothetical protein
MTDSKIIQSLEELAAYGSDFSAQVLEFIKRQQVEIERLTEALCIGIDQRDSEDFELIRKVRTDTIDELTKRITAKAWGFGSSVFVETIEATAYQMKGELL